MITGQDRKNRDAPVSFLLAADSSRNGVPAHHLNALKPQAGQLAQDPVQASAPFSRACAQHLVCGLVVGQALISGPQCAPSILPAAMTKA